MPIKDKINPEIIAKFFEILDYMIGSLMSDQPNEFDYKEGEYLLQYIKERLAEVLQKFEVDRKIPLMNIVFYGNEKGEVELVFCTFPEPEILNNFYLAEAAQMIKDACEKWDRLYLTPRPTSGKFDKAGVEFSTIKDMIAKKGKTIH